MAPPPAQPTSPLVVVVDDDAAVRAALEFALGLAGYRTQSCRSGEDLLRLDLPETGACLLVDERLPGVSGLRALGELRHGGCGLPAALITSHPHRQLRVAAARAGTPIIEKPLLGDAYMSWVKSVLPV